MPSPTRWRSSFSGTCLSFRPSLVLALLLPACGFAAGPLPALDAEKEYTVSGVSSGGYMAVQVHVAHSAIVKGAGAIAGGPYYCARGSAWTAYYSCMAPGWFTPLPSTPSLVSATQELAQSGRIDPTSHLASARAWLFSGTEDETVTRPVVDALKRYYEQFRTEVVLVGDKPAGHGMVTVSSATVCGATQPPYIVDCDYDAAGELLRYLLGQLVPGNDVPQSLRPFDQTAFGAYAESMADEGYVYVPKACETQRCRVHVAFHGCRQTRDDIGDRFVRDAGYNRWAEANRLIVLYPQAIRRYWGLYNPRGCWDWWGYTGAQYATKDGAQIRAVKAMLDRLSAPRQ